jgi:hypothetical protein
MKHLINSSTTVALLTWSTGLILAFGLQAAEPKLDPSKLPPASAKKEATFEKDIKALFEKSCVKCHSGDKPKGKLLLNTREGVLKGGEDGAVVVASKSDKSRLVYYASDLVPDMEMPPLPKRRDFPPLTKEQVGLVRAWIDQGAK